MKRGVSEAAWRQYLFPAALGVRYDLDSVGARGGEVCWHGQQRSDEKMAIFARKRPLEIWCKTRLYITTTQWLVTCQMKVRIVTYFCRFSIDRINFFTIHSISCFERHYSAIIIHLNQTYRYTWTITSLMLPCIIIHAFSSSLIPVFLFEVIDYV